MYGKEQFSMEARGGKMLADFKKHAKKCGFIAQAADVDVPERFLLEMCELSRHLEAELQAMRSRYRGASK